jgi:adenine phosphoribosyltransferase
MNLKDKIRVIPDYPKEGVRFKDITTLLKDGAALKYTIEQFTDYCLDKDVDLVVGPESRGFIFGTPLAVSLGAGFVPIRKTGKLPAETERIEYSLEYGSDILEIHKDAILPGQRVIICDDLLATGGTVQSTAKLIEKLGGIVVGICFLIELEFLNGRDKISEYDVFSLVKY